ncbi:MAG: putative C-S lyase [Gammaproteobacteria bacterium]|nr:putative C-S lyase [Gammaproteobacteria bacterium]
MNDKYNLDNCPDRSNTGALKWDRYKDEDILPMWVADMDFAVAPAITDALRQRLEHPVYGYTRVSARLNQVIVERMQQLYKWPIRAEWLVWVPGVVASVNVACRALGASQSNIYTAGVVYPHITEAPQLNDRRLVQVPMRMQNRRWVMDLDWIARQEDADNEILILCNPHNPGGSVYTRGELQQLVEIAEARDLMIISDEVHSELILEPGVMHTPIASLGDSISTRCITLMAPSKTFNLAGLGCSFAVIADPQLRRRFVKASQGIVSHLNMLGYIAAQAAYEHASDWHNTLLDHLRANRDYLISEINQIRGLKLDPIEATYLAWIDVSGLQLDDPHQFFQRAGLGFSPGREFGDDRFMRLNFGCSRTTLHEAVARIRTAVNSHWGTG